MTMKKCLLLACMALMSTYNSAIATSLCGQFSPPAVDAFALQGAVFRLEGADPSDIGTGYLISSTQGYLLTAQHVVKQPKPGKIIEATSPALPGVVLDAKIVGDLTKSDTPVDVALLKVVDPSKVTRIRPIDISLNLPGHEDKLHTMGYPKFGDLNNTVLQTTEVEDPSFDPSSGNIQTNDAIAKPGASGSPLLNVAGDTVGTATTTLGVSEQNAWFVPMESVIPLLDQIPASGEALKIESMLKSNAISPEMLAATLENTNEVSNLDLYELMRLLHANHTKGLISRDLLRCPISYALEGRGLFDLVLDMQEADASVRSDANLHIAQRDIALGNPVLAAAHSQQAMDGYKSLGDSNNVLRAQLILAQAQYQSDILSQAKSSLAGVLEHVSTLPPTDVGDAYLLAGEIDSKGGDFNAARTHFQQASDNFAGQKQFDQAAYAKRLTASIDLRQGSIQAAEVSSDDAIQFYKKAGNISGQADLLYDRAKAQAASGNVVGLKKTAVEYINTSPNGVKADEMKKVLSDVKLP
jgi:tetratricopeptide (TPR) repeat protein